MPLRFHTRNVCPQCGQGSFFKHPVSFDYRKWSMMNESCGNCGLSFQQEPGFYFGAMYVSYAINVLIMMLIWGITYMTFPDDYSIWLHVLAAASGGLIFTPWTFRWSRLVWIGFFISKKVN
jgi:uncharacterized protein (DUF983 family)